ncbi:hypothetical protein EV203_12430 [Caldanaerobacter subterraneus]|uniref:Uncharacterized protein n=1 Tax=Caldanaerobacter subterraneus TaxID=911092 RepID=A0A4R2JH65_9THEO|nr:hypothetical protein EV203_12430 [Caldanaerobacter subterraneus]
MEYLIEGYNSMSNSICDCFIKICNVEIPEICVCRDNSTLCASYCGDWTCLCRGGSRMEPYIK